MRVRLVAAAAGILVVVYAALAYSLSPNPVIARTNGVEPLYGALSIPAGARVCQQLPSVPGGATYMRMAIDSQPRGRGVLKAAVQVPGGVVVRGTARDLQHGLFAFGLSKRTVEARRGRFCIANRGNIGIRLSGELKKTPFRHTPSRTGVASVAFLEPGTSTLLSRAHTIARRFGEGQVGWVGTWALVAAALFVLAAWGTALWWLVTRPGESP